MIPDPIELLEIRERRKEEYYMQDIRKGICPNCGISIKSSKKCNYCGIEFTKYLEYNTQSKELKVYADDIPF